MGWKIALALLELARILARHVDRAKADGDAEARIFLKQMEKADAAIAKARAARARVGDTGSVRQPDKNSRD